ncbi:Uncharacterised protein [BD1-7 clade bacterium]|uniref:Phage tail collar domain-containing protein n=1 Tax=BD1-7 clade bacterium TaxID=2029982 RepID=A0A5S9PGI1_9GAMM|nr:Uncharacterised protein [BD1-7 clade bacterium]CAA0103192.1 Uncharacterised protein [BD1-7 clade bacterium]
MSKRSIKQWIAIPIGCFFSTLSLSAFATCTDDRHIGTICWTAAWYCPQGYAPASGQLLSVSSNPALFSLLGSSYGGNGISTFALPDIRGRAITGKGVGPGLSPPATLGQSVGQEFIEITPNKMPTHTHDWSMANSTFTGTVRAVETSGDSTQPNGRFPARASLGKPYDNDTNYLAAANSVEVTINNAPVTTSALYTPTKTPEIFAAPPQLVLTACIALTGIYPSQN